MHKTILIIEFIFNIICLILSYEVQQKELCIFIIVNIIFAFISLLLLANIIQHKEYLEEIKCTNFSEPHQLILIVLAFFPIINIIITFLLLYQQVKYLAWKYY